MPQCVTGLTRLAGFSARRVPVSLMTAIVGLTRTIHQCGLFHRTVCFGERDVRISLQGDYDGKQQENEYPKSLHG